MSALWIDTDVALGGRSGDVDDGFALAAVLAAGAPLLGVSTVFGNTRAARAADCARALVARAGAAHEVIAGAERPGADSAAAERLAALPAGTHVLLLGPLTNFAAALRRDPRLATRVSVAVVGGNLASWGRWAPLWPFEFNLAKDAAAARAVLHADQLERHLFPLDVCRRLLVGPRFLLALARSPRPLARWLARHSWRWLAYAPLRHQRLAFPLWDAVPALAALGLLDAHSRPRRLRCVGRGQLRAAPDAPLHTCARAIDAGRARAALLSLLR